MTNLIPIPAKVFIEEAESLLDTWYLWGGKGHTMLGPNEKIVPSPYFGVDCSGFVALSYWSAGGSDIRYTWWTKRFWTDLPTIEIPKPGTLALYSAKNTPDSPISHVMIYLGSDHPRGQLIGACHGDHTTTSLDQARKQGAQVLYQANPLYRPGFRGYRQLPLAYEISGT
jgi:cell wall-associated NlpC family hydrolase